MFEKYNAKDEYRIWKDKFDKNVLRDKRKSSELESSGWRVIVVWECEISKDHLKKSIKSQKH